MMNRRLTHRLIALLLSAPLMGSGVQSVYAHAGHNHGPEIAAPTVADVPPRFYAQSDAVEVVLAFPRDGRAGAPTLYVASKADNAPISGATVVADILSGSKAKIQVVEGETSGAYLLRGLGRPETTVSLALEVSNGDLMEILSMDNILPTAPGNGAAAGGSAADMPGADEPILGLPRYLVLALVAINGVVAGVAALALLLWITRTLSRKRGQRAADQAVEGQTTSHTASSGKLPLLMLAGSVLAFASPEIVRAHAGDDHSGASLAPMAGTGGSALHFLAIDAQFEGDVRTTQVMEWTLPKSSRALGQVEIRSDRKAVVTPPVEGKLLAGAANEGRVPVQGDEVKKGDVLVVVEQVIAAAEKVTLTSDRAQVEAELNQARQELALATREQERADRLSKIISAREVDQARSARKIAQDKVTGLENRLKTLTSALTGGAGPNVRQVPIVSPISGTVTLSHAVLGEYVRTDKTLFEIVNVEEVFVGADVFETDIALVRNARTARITLEAYPNESFSGTLHSIGQEINRETRSAHVLFAVSNPDQKLRGGMFANIEIESGTSRSALIVPKGAVISQDGIRQVFKKVAPETFQAQTVTVSEFREDVAVLTEGVKVGDRVAVSGLYQIRMSPVVPAPDSTAPAAEGPK